MAVRRNTSVPGSTSRTATRISRYGMPQITHIAANSAQLRRVIADDPVAHATNLSRARRPTARDFRTST